MRFIGLTIAAFFAVALHGWVNTAVATAKIVTICYSRSCPPVTVRNYNNCYDVETVDGKLQGHCFDNPQVSCVCST
ncbi:hypothetical protein Pmar_PMAR008618 [Perkinsus marinus ATCC 50983]|uniref:Uncharacterized protein n=1 Tax=Perkinsus marinus (strain ATCC 50983 / TXsc) TaxID=423536 RepID=C5LEE8_PERM5|nr:hypothetical protein Pmar_PMAR008618 [Perkinsus marinus ATCC 50983]EER04891.1 hypothetical protein Pmar_PMAR008618 [Perkinsus marinus ATCC 50983]|eukprot:XP_002773075.1 hypothetical protein Pmar_PMAR008618 [Perkinsus marinus ATCC 50983]